MSKPKKAYSVYLLISFLQMFFFWTAITVDSIYFVVTAKLDPLQLVLVGTTLELAILIFEIPTGIVADMYSRRLSTIIGFTLIGVGFIVMGAWALFLPILAAQLIWGLGHTFTSGAIEAWITDEIGEENAAQAFLHGAQRSQIGGMVGIVTGTLLGMVSLRLPILVSGALFIFLAVLMIIIMPEEHFHPARQENMHSMQNMLHTFKRGVGMLRIRPALISILAIGFFYGLYSEGFDRLWVALMLDRFTFPLFQPVVWFGLINLGDMGLSAVALSIVKKRLNLSGNRPLILALILASAGLSLSLGLFAFAGKLWLAIALLWSIGILRNLIYPLHTAWTNQKLDPQVRATIISMAGQVDAIGQIAGGPGVGVIARRISMPIGILVSSLLLTPVLGLLGWQYRKNQPEETTESQPTDQG